MHTHKTIGAFEAKTHFSQLLNLVAKGDEIIITRHGHAVARLAPLENKKQHSQKIALQEIRRLRSGTKLGEKLTIKEMIEEGRS